MLAKSLLPLAAILLAAVPARAQNTSANIIDNLLQVPELSTIANFVNSSGYEDIRQKLSGNTTFTIFAPSNSALQGAVSSGFNPNDTGLIKAVINYHITRGNLAIQQLQPNSFQLVATELTNETYAKLPNNTGQVVAVAKDGDSVKVNDVNVTRSDIFASNGVIHIIEKFLFPPLTPSNVSAAEGLTEFSRSLNQTNFTSVIDDLRGATIFVPSDSAFSSDNVPRNATKLANNLRFHVIEGRVLYTTVLTDNQTVTTIQGNNLTITKNGGQITVNGAKVTRSNILVSNGVMHVIDSFLIPPNDGNNQTTQKPNGAMPASGEHHNSFTIALAVLVAFSVMLV